MFLNRNGGQDIFSSCLHSTETALIRVLNDILLFADFGVSTVLALLDLTAAFNTTDYDTLLAG